jgi:citrate lyase gamma subunit
MLRTPLSLCAVLVALTAGCYSFRGGSVPADVHSVAIPVASDQSAFGNAALRDQLTTLLVQKFTRDNSLLVTDKTAADAVLQTTIQSVTTAATAVGSNDRASVQRLTVSVRATFDNLRTRRTIWEKSFSNWADFDPAGALDARDRALSLALEKITDDILLEAVARW